MRASWKTEGWRPSGARNSPSWPRSSELQRRREKRTRAGMLRLSEQLLHRPLLDHLPPVHHQRTGAKGPDDARAVRDEDEAQLQFIAQLAQQFDDLNLQRYIERAHRFIAYEQPRTDSER